MSTLKKIVIFHMVLLSLCATSIAKVHMAIFNRLGEEYDLTVHCKSADDDLGIHVLKNSASFSFKFKPNWIGTTLFFCGLKWQKGSLSFEAYYFPEDRRRCKRSCHWDATRGGVRGYNNKGDNDMTLEWD